MYIKKSTRNYLTERHNEYTRYANRLIKLIKKNIPHHVIIFEEKPDMNPLEKAAHVVSYRFKRFEKEYNNRVSKTNLKERFCLRKSINMIFKKNE